MDRLTPAQRHQNTLTVRSKDSQIKWKLRRALWHAGFRYRQNVREVFGCPDVAFMSLRVAIFCDSDFENTPHDCEVNVRLAEEGWTVLRFFGRDIKQNVDECLRIIAEVVARKKSEARKCTS